MSYFDNANNRVTRKSFGSKVDKEFKREGVIPVKDRNKDKVDKVAEAAAKYKDLNKKVNDRRLQELKDQKFYNEAIQEGYKALKDELIKDFISEICVESLLVDENVVLENLKNIVEIVERKVDDIGGFEGVKHIAESTKNPVLLNIVGVCEGTAKKVGERAAKECSSNKGSKPNFGLQKIELEEYDYRKKEIGSETIVNNIKDKVFQVVQDEQKLSSDRQMVMDDIQNKVSELEVPVEEAMSFIFNKPGIEEDTLFNSLMRRQYKQLMESNSSAIFESFDYKETLEPLFENEEFEMNDVSMVDLDPEDKKEIEDMFLNEAKKLEDVEDEEYEAALENFYNILVEGSQNIKSYVQAEHFNSIIRKAQDELEYLEEKYIHNIQKHARKISNKKLDKSIAKWEREIEETRSKIKNEKDPVCLDDYREDLRILVAELKALKAEKSHRGKQLKIAREANPYMKSTMESVDEVKERLNRLVETDDMEVHGDEPAPSAKEMEKLKSPAKVKEEVILCPKCGKEQCSCKVAKESDEVVTEGKISDMISNYFSKSLSKKIAKRDFGPVKERMLIMIENCMTMQHITDLETDINLGIQKLEKAKKDCPEAAEKIDEHIKWLKIVAKEQLRQRANKIKKGAPLSESTDLVEYYIDKLETICESMNKVVEAHENARNNVVESLTREINDELTLVPYLQTKDVNLNNLEFIYKVKTVCETLKNNLKYVESEQEAATLKRAVDLNISSINETMEVIKEREDMEYKVKLLNAGKTYLNKINNVLENNAENYTSELVEATTVFSSPEDVEKIFNQVREYYVIESTDNDLMELVMAEAIVEYTVLETFNTLNLINYTKDSVRQMARKNISYVSEGLFGKKVNKLPEYNDMYGEPVENKNKYISLYEKSLKDLTEVVKKAFPGCVLSEDNNNGYKEKEYDDVILVENFKTVINLKKNYNILKNLNPTLFKNCNSFDDVDGEKMMSYLDKVVFKKMSNFKETEGTYGMYYNKSFEGISVFCDEDFERISISLKLPYKK